MYKDCFLLRCVFEVSSASRLDFSTVASWKSPAQLVFMGGGPGLAGLRKYVVYLVFGHFCGVSGSSLERLSPLPPSCSGGQRWPLAACDALTTSEGGLQALSLILRMAATSVAWGFAPGTPRRGAACLGMRWLHIGLILAWSACLLFPAESAAPAEASVQTEGVKSERRVYSESQKARVTADQKSVKESGAVVLSSNSYNDFMEAHPLVMVLFYAPWCYWSRAALPEFDAAAKLLSHHNPPVIAARVDCTESEDVCTDTDVREYPTIRLYVEGKAHPYEGRRYRTHIVHWVDLKVDRDKQLASTAHLDELIGSSSSGAESHLVAVAAFPPDYNKSSFQSVARTFGDEVLFGDTTDPAVIKHLQDAHIVPKLAGDSSRKEQLRPPFVAVFSAHQGEPGVHIYQGQVAEVNELRTFVRQWLFPVVSLFDSESIGDAFFRDPRPKFVLLVDSEKHGALLEEAEEANPKDPLLAAFRAVAAKHRASVAATVSGNKKTFGRQLFSVLGVEDETLPQVRLMLINNNSEGKHKPTLKFRPSAPLPSVAAEGGDRQKLEEALSSFVSGVLSRELSPYFRSEAPPEVPEGKGSVRTLVASTFAAEIAKEPNVLVEFYAPWCGFCRKMEPAYKELARRVAGVSGLLIARIDATRNEVEGVQVAGYPTVYLYRRGHGEPLLYAGDRSTRDMLEWLSLRVKGTSAFSPDELMAADLSGSGNPTASVLEEL
ncbi:hypothetical protein Esti_003122 [Eimeria stiedai]